MIQSNTGSAQPQSALNFLNSAIGTVADGIDVYNRLTGKTTTAPAPGVQNPVPKKDIGTVTPVSKWKEYLPWILGGLVLVLAGLFIFKRR